MRIGYSPEQEELRRELRSYFSRLMTPERTEALSSVEGEYGTGNAYRDTVAQMGRDGWLGSAGPPSTAARPAPRWSSSSSSTRPPSPARRCRS